MSRERERERLVKKLKAGGYIESDEVEKAFLSVPREEFLPSGMGDEAYVDHPLPIGNGQTISAPSMIAIMMEALELKKGMKVLEIGAGSGYHAALAGYIVGPKGKVISIERVGKLAKNARKNIQKAGLGQVITVVQGDGSKGYPEAGPYHRIYLTCAAPDAPTHLEDQVKTGGMILAPVGKSRWWQDLIRLTKREGDLKRESLGGCVFVPMIGKYGFRGKEDT